MKKIAVFILIILGILVFSQGGFLLGTVSYGGRYTVYDGEIDEEYTLNLAQAAVRTLMGSEGQCVRFDGSDLDVEKIIKRLRVEKVYEQELSGIFVIYGYSPRLGEGVYLDGKKVNIQIAKRGETVTVGTPLIKGSY